MWPVAALGVLLALGGCSGSGGESECERAVARMKRLDERGKRPPLSARMARQIVAQCEQGGPAAYDRVVQCAKTQTTDADGQRCIDAFLDDVLRPTPAGPDDPARRAINPLLDR